MKKLIKTAIVTSSMIVSVSAFAHVGAHVNGSAQANVDTGHLVNGVAGAVKNTGQNTVNAGVGVAQKTLGTAINHGTGIAH